MRLRRSDTDAPGLSRVRRGRGFSYLGADGRAVDEQTRERIRALVIPPAWKQVWISPHPYGHIQAVGTDDAGRRQYLYHPAWTQAQDRAKHERVRELARRLPAFRSAVEQDLRRPGLARERILAVALRLLDAGMFRTGGDEYEQENGSHGVATLLRTHVVTRKDVLQFCFPAKSGKERQAALCDPLLARAVLALKRSQAPGDRLLQYRDACGWHEVHAEDINSAFKALAGEQFTVKDLRTWAATVTAAVALAQGANGEARGKPGDAEQQAISLVAEQLGNTPAVARRSYVDPVVIDQHAQGRTVRSVLDRLDPMELTDPADRAAVERAVLGLLRRAGP